MGTHVDYNTPLTRCFFAPINLALRSISIVRLVFRFRKCLAVPDWSLRLKMEHVWNSPNSDPNGPRKGDGLSFYKGSILRALQVYARHRRMKC